MKHLILFFTLAPFVILNNTFATDIHKNNSSSSECYYEIGSVLNLNKHPIAKNKPHQKKSTKSGKVLCERAMVEYNRKNTNAAIKYWEKGIEIDPSYSSNYYWAAKTYSQSNLKAWTLIYGEIFINLEPTTERSREISNLLYQTYKSFFNTIDNNASTMLDDETINKIFEEQKFRKKIPFDLIFEAYMKRVADKLIKDNSVKLNINNLYLLRYVFVKTWFKEKKNKLYPNIMFDWYKDLIESGHFKSYNYWILSSGNLDEFKTYYDKNKEEFYEFLTWYDNNILNINKKSRLYRAQY